MTPMIDILLVLLIIFMTISPVSPHGLDAVAPEPADRSRPIGPDERTVAIVIARDGSLMLNETATDWEKLSERLVDIFRMRAEKVAFVKADPELDYQVIARAIDTAKGSGVDRVGLLTAKMEAGK